MARLVVAINLGQQAPFKRLRWDAAEEQTKEYAAWREHVPALVRVTCTAGMGKWLPTGKDNRIVAHARWMLRGPPRSRFERGKRLAV